MSLFGLQDSLLMEAVLGLLITLLGVVVTILLAEAVCFVVMMTWTWRDGRRSAERSHGHDGLLP